MDFAEGIGYRGAGERWRRCLEGKGAFRHFKNALYQGHPELISSWHVFTGAKGTDAGCAGLVDEGLIEEDVAQRFRRDHREPDAPNARTAEFAGSTRPCLRIPPRTGGARDAA